MVTQWRDLEIHIIQYTVYQIQYRRASIYGAMRCYMMMYRYVAYSTVLYCEECINHACIIVVSNLKSKSCLLVVILIYTSMINPTSVSPRREPNFIVVARKGVACNEMVVHCLVLLGGKRKGRATP